MLCSLRCAALAAQLIYMVDVYITLYCYKSYVEESGRVLRYYRVDFSATLL